MIVGITGGIGSGKSVVSRLLRMLDFPVYDSDARAKALYDTDADLRNKLMAMFGTHVYKDGHVCRRVLAEAVFDNPEQLQRLNALVHPAVFRDFERWCREQTAAAVFVESAILLQTDFRRYTNRVLVVDAPVEVFAGAGHRPGIHRGVVAEVMGQIALFQYVFYDNIQA